MIILQINGFQQPVVFQTLQAADEVSGNVNLL